MAQKVIAWDDATDRPVRTTKDPADITSGSSTGGAIPDIVAAGSETVSNGATSKAITFTNAFPNTSFAVVCNLVNTTDSSPQFQPLVVTVRSASGFTAKWNAPVDSANYKIDYIAVTPCTTFRANNEDISNGQLVKISSLLGATSYSICPQVINLVDSSPLFQPSTIKTKSATQFITYWNSTFDSSNYDLHWAALGGGSCPNLKSNVESLSNSVTTKAVTFAFPQLSSSSYACVCRMHNTTDSSVLYMPITVTSKSLSGFTAKWNTPTDSTNYEMSWLVFITN